jgi:hypothetical protein
MTVLDVRQFGGLLPSVEPRNLPAEAAQTAQNLDMRHGDFRPIAGPGTSVTTVAAACMSVFRTPSGVWLNSASDANFVLGQLQDTSDERVYLTGRSAYPEAWLSGTYRRLGVPMPATKPTCSVNVVNEFTTEEAEAGRKSVISDFQAAITSGLTYTYAGYENTIASLPRGAFWLPHGTVSGMPTNTAQMGCYCLPIVASGSSYKMQYEEDNWALDATLGSAQITYLGNPYLAIPMYCQARIYDFDTAAFTTAAQAIKKPDDGVTQLLTNDEITELAARYEALFDTTAEPQKAMIAELQQHIDRVAKAINPVSGSMLIEANKAFFAKTDVDAEIDDAIANFAETVFLAAKAAFNVPPEAAIGDVYHPGGVSDGP